MTPMMWSIFITSISTSTIITMSSHHWLLAWLGLELNTLSILPIIMKTNHPRATEATTKYFITQTTAAAMMLFASTLNAWQTGQWSIMHMSTGPATMVLILALMTKLGLTPVHFWYPEVLQGTTMNTAMLVSTWQKMAPLTLLYLTMNHLPNHIITTIGLLSVLIGGLMGLNQTQTRKILAFSSIAHMGWLSLTLTMNPHLTTLTMLVYMTMTSALFSMLNTTTAKTLKDLGKINTPAPMLVAMTMITLMSLGGLPPLTGFMPKLLILKTLTLMDLTTLSITLALASLPSLFFYIRMTYLLVLTTPPNTAPTEHKWRLTPTHPKTLIPMITLSTLLLPLTPVFYNTL
uniref:NADH-ubiquinone oxidoreductase chain 2 n=1 Tax=Cryptactites peringueyi TaxID=401528 RepID=A0A088FFK6_9SAUR|nr:NADH dehydrogenase subunit 2 [Cryptactites peringueyi]